MMFATQAAAPAFLAVSPLMLSDRLLTLAKEADRVGLRSAAQHLLHLASTVLDPCTTTPRQRRLPRNACMPGQRAITVQ
jgi:hypothetical protein